MKFLCLTRMNGASEFINFENVREFFTYNIESEKSTKIAFEDGNVIRVKETPTKIMSMLVIDGTVVT